MPDFPPAPPAVHRATHEDGGADEISVASLSGELADPQPPKAHVNSHKSGGADALLDADIDGIVGFDLGAHVGRHKKGGADPLAKADIESLLGISSLIEGWVSIDPPSIPAGSSVNVDVTITGLTVSHSVIVMANDEIEAGIIVQAAWVPKADTLRVRFYNARTAAYDPFIAMYTYWAWI